MPQYHVKDPMLAILDEAVGKRVTVTIPIGPVVWSRNSCDPWVVILEKAAEALSTSNRWPTCLAELLDPGKQ
jgi:hypothetical protein